MEIYKGIQAVTHSEILAVMTNASLIRARRDGKIKQLRRGCNSTPALFAFDSLPYKYKEELLRRQPDAAKLAQSKSFIDKIEPDGAAFNFFELHELPDGRNLTTEKIQEYANSAAILWAFRRALGEHIAERAKQGKKAQIDVFWHNASDAMSYISDRFPNSLPFNYKRLKMKYYEFFAGDKPNYACLITGKFNNNNAREINRDGESLLLVMLSNGSNKFDNEYMATWYNKIAELMEWKPITGRTVGNYRRKLELESAPGRLGKNEFYNKVAMQVKRRKPSLPLYMWSVDGWDVELYHAKTKTDKKGHHVTTYTNRQTLIVVLDPVLNYPIGYAIGDHETPELIREALRNAVNHTCELFGQRYRTNQIQSDRYAFKNMTPFYDAVGVANTPAEAGNAKSKPIERYFLYLNEKYCKEYPNWSGYGITSRKENQPNSDWLNANRRSFPDEIECREQIRTIMAKERGAKQAAYVQMWEHVPEERRIPLSDEQYLLHFGAEGKRRNSIASDGLTVRLLGQDYTYDSFDVNFRRHTHLAWKIKYDPANLDKVLAVSENGEYRFILEQKYIQAMALADRTEGDANELQRVFDYNEKVLLPEINEQLSIANTHVHELFTNNPKLGNSLDKALLCDSRGQHKDRRNQKRLKLDDDPNIIDADCEEVINDIKVQRQQSHFELM